MIKSSQQNGPSPHKARLWPPGKGAAVGEGWGSREERIKTKTTTTTTKQKILSRKGTAVQCPVGGTRRGWSSSEVANQGENSGSGLASARAATWTDWDSVQTGSLLCRKEGCVPAAQRWASGMTKRARPGLMRQLSLSLQVCQPRHGPGRLNGRSCSAFPGDLPDLVPPHQKAPGA